MKLHLPGRRIWRVAIYLLSLLLIVVAIDLVLVQIGRHVTPGYTTTRITEPVLSDGRIDYLTALENHFGAGVTPENNAAPLILQALGRGALPTNQPPDGITARLAMPPLPEKGDYFQSRQAYLEDPALPESADVNELAPLLEHPWKATGHPRTAAWLAANEKPLAKLAEAATRPRYFMPFNGGTPPELLTDLQLPHLNLLRQAGQALICRAMMKAGSGDLASARQDLMTVHQLARLLGQGATLIDRLVGYAIDSLASSAEAWIAIDAKLDQAQAGQWLAALRSLPPVADFDEVVDFGERYLFLNHLQYASKHGMYQTMERIEPMMRVSGQLFGVPLQSPWARRFRALLPVRVARMMQDHNEWGDRFITALRKPAGVERREATANVQKQFEASNDASQPWRSWVSIGWAAIAKCTNRTDSTQAKRNLAIVAMALAEYRAEHGGFPASLEGLKSADLSELPIDPFTAKPLTYRPLERGYLLYSIGPNLRDENGAGDDLTVRAAGAATSTTRP